MAGLHTPLSVGSSMQLRMIQTPAIHFSQCMPGVAALMQSISYRRWGVIMYDCPSTV